MWTFVFAIERGSQYIQNVEHELQSKVKVSRKFQYETCF